MSGLIDIKVPDIGDFKDIPVIEVFVKPGDKVKAEDPLVSLESDKATMEVPSPRDGVVKSVVAKVGDKVSEGAVIVQFEDASTERAGGGCRGACSRHRRFQGRSGHRNLREGRRQRESGGSADRA